MFISPDSLLPNIYDPQQLNRFAYTRNNPLKYTDPIGHIPALAIPVAIFAFDYAASTALGVTLGIVVGGSVIPARARAMVAGQYAFIRVKRDVVALVANGRQHLAFDGFGVGEHGQSLIAVGRQDHVVVRGAALARMHLDALVSQSPQPP